MALQIGYIELVHNLFIVDYNNDSPNEQLVRFRELFGLFVQLSSPRPVSTQWEVVLCMFFYLTSNNFQCTLVVFSESSGMT